MKKGTHTAPSATPRHCRHPPSACTPHAPLIGPRPAQHFLSVSLGMAGRRGLVAGVVRVLQLAVAMLPLCMPCSAVSNGFTFECNPTGNFGCDRHKDGKAATAQCARAHVARPLALAVRLAVNVDMQAPRAGQLAQRPHPLVARGLALEKVVGVARAARQRRLKVAAVREGGEAPRQADTLRVRRPRARQVSA